MFSCYLISYWIGYECMLGIEVGVGNIIMNKVDLVFVFEEFLGRENCWTCNDYGFIGGRGFLGWCRIYREGF